MKLKKTMLFFLFSPILCMAEDGQQWLNKPPLDDPEFYSLRSIPNHKFKIIDEPKKYLPLLEKKSFVNADSNKESDLQCEISEHRYLVRYVNFSSSNPAAYFNGHSLLLSSASFGTGTPSTVKSAMFICLTLPPKNVYIIYETGPL